MLMVQLSESQSSSLLVQENLPNNPIFHRCSLTVNQTAAKALPQSLTSSLYCLGLINSCRRAAKKYFWVVI